MFQRPSACTLTSKFSWAIATKPHQTKQSKQNPNMIIFVLFPKLCLKYQQRTLFAHPGCKYQFWGWDCGNCVHLKNLIDCFYNVDLIQMQSKNNTFFLFIHSIPKKPICGIPGEGINSWTASWVKGILILTYSFLYNPDRIISSFHPSFSVLDHCYLQNKIC